MRLDSFLTELDACERHMERALDSGTHTEVLLLNKQVTVRVRGQQQQDSAEHAGELRSVRVSEGSARGHIRSGGVGWGHAGQKEAPRVPFKVML